MMNRYDRERIDMTFDESVFPWQLFTGISYHSIVIFDSLQIYFSLSFSKKKKKIWSVF